MLTSAETLAALRLLAGADRKTVKFSDLAPPLRRAVMHHFGSLTTARRRAGIPQPRRKRLWSRGRVVRELRRLHRQGQPVVESHLRRIGRHDLVGAMAKYAGGIVAARHLAGLPEHTPRPGSRAQRWDREAVRSVVRTRHEAGESLAFSRVPTALAKAGIRHFGSWREAIEAAGLDYGAIRLKGRYSEEHLLRLLRALAQRWPDLSVSELRQRRGGAAILQHFGTAEAAGRVAGVPGWPRRRKHLLLSRRDTIARLRALGRRTPGGVRHTDDRTLWKSAVRHFGSWRAAIEATGCPRPPTRQWHGEGVAEALRRRQRAGRSLSAAAVRREDRDLYLAARLCFGSYAAARRRVTERRYTRWSRERLIEKLRELGRASAPVTGSRMGRALASAAQSHFGSLNAARRRAGVRGSNRRHWTREAVLRDLRRLARHVTPVTTTQAGTALKEACHRLWGSFRRACDAAGVPSGRDRFWRAELVLAELRRRASGRGHLTATMCIPSLAAGARRHFGSVAAACAAAGVEWRGPLESPGPVDHAAPAKATPPAREAVPEPAGKC
jgi:hypothetical protein